SRHCRQRRQEEIDRERIGSGGEDKCDQARRSIGGGRRQGRLAIRESRPPESPAAAIRIVYAKMQKGKSIRLLPERYPPVTLIWRETAGRRVRRSMTKSWPFGLRPIASSIAAESSSFPSEARKGRRRSAASSWPRHM